MKPFGLTGNIGCGKSTVATLLGTYQDVLILDCDRIAKEIISSGKHKKEITTLLGADVFFDKKVDFQRVAKIIFEEPERKRLLEALVHPLVWSTVDEKIAMADNNICIVESAIIFETKSEERFAGITAVTCNPHEQLRRLREIRQMDDTEIQARINQQLPSSEKEHRAQFVIHTDCSLKQLKDRVSNLYHNLKQQKGFQL